LTGPAADVLTPTPVDLRTLARLATEHELEVLVFVDSESGLRLLEPAARAASGRIAALVEMGFAGGRTGVRTESELGWTTTKLWDQHGLLQASERATPLALGDVLTFGISHPCSTFDRWRTLLEIDDEDTVVGVIETWF
jgi:D-serine deaminase-like pyridoxal phosphate-dependent protein